MKIKQIIFAGAVLLVVGCRSLGDLHYLDQLKENFVDSLSSLGVPASDAQQLLMKLERWHPGDQERIYHNLFHSLMVYDVVSAIIESARPKLEAAQKKLVLLAAAFHDLDPDRSPNTPPTVMATLDFLEKNSYELDDIVDAQDLKKIKALILYTDFDPDEKKQRRLLARADHESERFVQDPWLKEWGRRLRIADLSAMYTRDVPFAEKAIRGLANEVRTQSSKSDPTDQQMLAGTYRFLKNYDEEMLKLDLPKGMKARFTIVLKHFKAMHDRR